MRLLVEDAIASYSADIVGQFGLFRSELKKFVELKFNFSVLTLRCLSDILATSSTAEAQTQLLHFLEWILIYFFNLFGTE